MEHDLLWKEHENENRMRHFKVLSMGSLPVMLGYFILVYMLGYGNISSVTVMITLAALGFDLLHIYQVVIVLIGSEIAVVDVRIL